MLSSRLDNIEGIGEKTSQLLISNFGSVKKIVNADEDELIKLIGMSKAKKIIISLQND